MNYAIILNTSEKTKKPRHAAYHNMTGQNKGDIGTKKLPTIKTTTG